MRTPLALSNAIEQCAPWRVRWALSGGAGEVPLVDPVSGLSPLGQAAKKRVLISPEPSVSLRNKCERVFLTVQGHGPCQHIATVHDRAWEILAMLVPWSEGGKAWGRVMAWVERQNVTPALLHALNTLVSELPFDTYYHGRSFGRWFQFVLFLIDRPGWDGSSRAIVAHWWHRACLQCNEDSGSVLQVLNQRSALMPELVDSCLWGLAFQAQPSRKVWSGRGFDLELCNWLVERDVPVPTQCRERVLAVLDRLPEPLERWLRVQVLEAHTPQAPVAQAVVRRL